MIKTPTTIEKGQHVDATSDKSQAVAAWRDGLAQLGELAAAEADLHEGLPGLKGKQVTVPKLKVVITDVELLTRSAPKPDARELEDAVNAWVISRLSEDAEAKQEAEELLEYLGPDGEREAEAGYHLTFEGQPDVTDQPQGDGDPAP